jgi:hypothetical protein
MKKKQVETFEFLGNKFNIDKNVVILNIYNLIIISILVYIGFIFFNMFILGNIDFFDIRNYIKQSVLILHGGIPYISIDYEYAILSLIPMMISVIIANLLGDIRFSMFIFQLLMIICNIITILSVYLIVLKLYQNNKIAFKAGLLYTISLVALYTTLTRYDAFPVCLITLSIMLFIYKKDSGYIISTIGFFTKIFPIVTYPFFILYNLKNGDKTNWKLIIGSSIILSIVLLLPFILMGGVDTLKPYLFASGTTVNMVYVNTFTYAIFSLINNVILFSIPITIISICMTCVLGIGILYLLYYIYISVEFSYKDMILAICLILSLLIITAKFHSPQYFMWITPLLVILVIDDIKKILIYYVFQIMTFIEFPIMFGKYYTNVTFPIFGSMEYFLVLFFFLLEYIILIILLIYCIDNNIWKKLLSIIES